VIQIKPDDGPGSPARAVPSHKLLAFALRTVGTRTA
jgi:hypothetical protein